MPVAAHTEDRRLCILCASLGSLAVLVTKLEADGFASAGRVLERGIGEPDIDARLGNPPYSQTSGSTGIRTSGATVWASRRRGRPGSLGCRRSVPFAGTLAAAYPPIWRRVAIVWVVISSRRLSSCWCRDKPRSEEGRHCHEHSRVWPTTVSCSEQLSISHEFLSFLDHPVSTAYKHVSALRDLGAVAWPRNHHFQAEVRRVVPGRFSRVNGSISIGILHPVKNAVAVAVQCLAVGIDRHPVETDVHDGIRLRNLVCRGGVLVETGVGGVAAAGVHE